MLVAHLNVSRDGHISGCSGWRSEFQALVMSADKREEMSPATLLLADLAQSYRSQCNGTLTQLCLFSILFVFGIYDGKVTLSFSTHSPQNEL